MDLLTIPSRGRQLFRSSIITHTYVHTVFLSGFTTNIPVHRTYVHKCGLSGCSCNHYRNSLPDEKYTKLINLKRLYYHYYCSSSYVLDYPYLPSSNCPLSSYPPDRLFQFQQLDASLFPPSLILPILWKALLPTKI